MSVGDVLIVLRRSCWYPASSPWSPAASWCPDRVTAALQLLVPWWGVVAIGVVVASAIAGVWWLALIAAAVAVGVGVK